MASFPFHQFTSWRPRSKCQPCLQTDRRALSCTRRDRAGLYESVAASLFDLQGQLSRAQMLSHAEALR
eukprot:4529392-Pleurochrysis_carterae.AAC.1